MWHQLSVAEVEDRLSSRAELGLTTDDAATRLAEIGPNAVDEVDERPWLPLLVQQFTGPLTAILLVAIVISLAIGEELDAIVIGAILVANGLLGFVQEWRAGEAIAALSSMMVPFATVTRDGRPVRIAATELVPGDRVELEAGDRVPADLRLVAAAGVSVDESALTGESVPVDKTVEACDPDAPLAERQSMLWTGTDLTTGWAAALVVETGGRTEFGQIVELTASAEHEPLPLERSLARLGRSLGIIAVGLAALTVLIGIVGGRPADEMFLTGVSLAVAIVPEGLPAVVTVTLALGIRAMSRRNALLRHLEAAETLGAASVICTDKTGTLTENRMKATSVWIAGEWVDPASPGQTTAEILVGLAETVMICSHVDRDAEGQFIGDPTEVALVDLAARSGVARPDVTIVEEIPFDSTRRMMTMTVDGPSTRSPVSHIKGAPEAVLGVATTIEGSDGARPLLPSDRAEIEAAVERMASRGLRVLAVARGHSDAVSLLGLVGLHDPPRAEVPDAVATSMAAGVTVIAMTGDAGPTALAIGREIGLPVDTVLTGVELDELDDEVLLEHLDGSSVLARVTPANKMRVVRLLQRQGAVVAMTGDGVNDAPALEQASIGIAMGQRGTDVARGASDVVLADDNFSSIVAAIEEGRRQYGNIRKFIRYLLSSNLGEVVAISGSVALGWPLILLPAQILWMNLLTDGVTALALGVEPAEPDAMDRPPRDPDEPIVDRRGIRWITLMGAAIGLGSLAVFWLSLGSGEGDDLVRAQTLAFTAMVLMEKMNVLNFRAERVSILRIGLFSNRWLVVAWFGAVGAQVAAVHVPGLSNALGTTALSLTDWVLLILAALPILMIGELVKWFERRRTPPAEAVRPLAVERRHTTIGS